MERGLLYACVLYYIKRTADRDLIVRTDLNELRKR